MKWHLLRPGTEEVPEVLKTGFVVFVDADFYSIFV